MKGLRVGIAAGTIGLLLVAAGLAMVYLFLLPRTAPSGSCPIRLLDATRDTGITFVHTDGSSGQKYIVETVTAGLALFDYDGDGNEDIYFLNGAPLRGTPAGQPAANALYRNDGGWRFTDVTEAAGVGDLGYGLGVTAADCDNDGFLDLYVSNYGPNVLYHNNGDGTFSDVTASAGVGRGHKVGAGVSFLDIDRDGDLDLYVSNYVKFTYDNHVVIWEKGFPTYAGPRAYEPEPDVLFCNNGDGTFTDVSLAGGIGQHAGTGMGIVSADFDNDGDTDVFVLNDVAAHFLFVNDGGGHFEEAGLRAGVAYNGAGDATGSMGVDCGDYDNDGWLDFYVTSYQNQLPILYRNLGNGTFEDVTQASGAGAGLYPYVNWGVCFADFDNDGHLDLFVANGHLQDNIDLYDDTTAYEVANAVFWNTGDGKFLNVSAQCGDGLAPKRSSRGAAVADLDNDGRLDVVVLNSRREPTVIRNATAARHHWLAVRLIGRESNRDGVGAHVLVTCGGQRQLAEVHSGRGYQSHWGVRLHFGLGSRERVERLEVRWPSGRVEVREDVTADRIVTMTEGETHAPTK